MNGDQVFTPRYLVDVIAELDGALHTLRKANTELAQLGDEDMARVLQIARDIDNALARATEATRSPVPADDEWVELGYVDTNVATIAVVNPLFAGALADHWEQYVDQLRPGNRAPLYREVPLETVWERKGDGWDDTARGPFVDVSPAVIVDTPSNGYYKVDGRFADVYDDGHLALVELRIVLWGQEDGA